MNRIGGLPWRLTFSYGRALQAAPQKAWSGKAENAAAGQRAFTHRARMNSLASKGEWKADLEKEGGIDLATKPVPPRPVPRLYLATPDVDDPSPLIASLPGLLAGADVAAVLLRLKPTDQRTMISRIKALAPAIQDSGAALLLDGHVELVARAGADGAHLTGIEAMEEALPTLKPDRIAGVGGLTTRHDSMAAGEAGADYVLFGEPDAKGTAAFGRGDRRAPAMVGRTVRAALRRLCGLARGGLANLRLPARISCWSAISSGPIRAVPRRR